jgi:hypothetical protein
MAAKKAVTFRLSEITVNELNALAKRYKVSQADVIAIIIHAIYAGLDLEQLDEYFEVARMV